VPVFPVKTGLYYKSEYWSRIDQNFHSSFVDQLKFTGKLKYKSGFGTSGSKLGGKEKMILSGSDLVLIQQ